MFEIVEAIHKALHTQSTFAFVLVSFLVVGLIAGGVAWLVDIGYKNEQLEKGNGGAGIDLRGKISELLSEGNRLQATCQSVHNPYNTPPAAQNL